MLEAINELIGSVMATPWAYVAIFVVSVVDAFFPPVPSETVVIAAAAVAAGGGQSLPWVILLAAAGAFIGDHVSYAMGRFLGTRAVHRVLHGQRGQRGRAAQARAERMLQVRGGVVIVAARFIPGGRTATTITAGALRYPLARFAAFDALAASCWATYAGLIGYFAGGLFEGNHLLAVVVGVGISVAVVAVVETARFLLRGRTGFFPPVAVTPRPLDDHEGGRREASFSSAYAACRKRRVRGCAERSSAEVSAQPTTPACRDGEHRGREHSSQRKGRSSEQS